MAERAFATIEVAGREVRLSNPDKVFFPQIGVTKRDLCDYYLTVGDIFSPVANIRSDTRGFEYPDGSTLLRRFADSA